MHLTHILCESIALKKILILFQLHRRMLHDDCFGVDEALNETAYGTGLVARGSHYLLMGVPEQQAATDREFTQKKVLAPWTFFTATTKTFDEWKKSYKMDVSIPYMII